MKKITLTIKERAILCDLLPHSGGKLQQIIVRDLLEKTGFTENETKKHEIKYADGAMTWNGNANDALFSFELSDAEINVLKETSASTNDAERITQHNLSLIEKIDSL
ncbi:MAG: hypothetical protein RBS07_07840 [Lentimicrobium sp.]|jgi:hypothetical protein|nr:hypothetical protein [Lentimicrobium sp.]